jgi:hypothetical protein
VPNPFHAPGAAENETIADIMRARPVVQPVSGSLAVS